MTRAVEARPFELGCNWWPRRSAMYLWRELDLGAVREEMAHLADMGFSVVRLFALAEDFMPAPLATPAAAVRALVEVCGAARDAGLSTVPTLVVVNMSGRMWWPSWMGEGRRDVYADPLLLRTQHALAEACARALAGDASVRAFDLTNEIDDAARPGSRHAGWLWAETLAAAVRRAAPGVPIQCGMHMPSLVSGAHLRVDDVMSAVDEPCMHAYPLYSAHARDALDPDLVPFSCALTSALAGGVPTLMQEFGLCTAGRGEAGRTIADDFLGAPRDQYLASEEEGAEYYRGVLERLLETGAAGAYAWCYADYDPRLFGRPPLDRAVRERTFGLVRADASEKPAAEVVRAFARRLREVGEEPRPAPPQVLDVSVDEFYAAPADHFARLYARYTEARPR